MRRRSPLRGRAAALTLTAGLLTVGAGEAGAQVCGDFDGPVPGTVGYRLIRDAATTNAQIYGAASLAERRLLPLLFKPGVKSVVQYGWQTTADALQVPVCRDGALERAAVDLGAGSFGLGVRLGPVALYASGSSTVHIISNGKPNERLPSAFAFPMVGGLLLPAAPVKRHWNFGRDDLSITTDLLAGAEFETPVGQLGLAYVASQGLYARVMGKQIKLFAGAAVTGLFSGEDTVELPYLRAGFAALDFISADLQNTALYGRQVRFPVVPQAGTGVDADQLDAETTGLLTVHFEQSNLGGYFDLSAAIALKPTADLYEATLSVHTLNYASQEAALANPEMLEQSAFGVRLSAGVVKLPALAYYGVSGGLRFKASLDLGGVKAFGDEEEEEVGPFYMSLTFNSAELLSVLPYAQDGAQLSLSGAFVFD